MKVLFMSYLSTSAAGGVTSVGKDIVHSLADGVELHVVCEEGSSAQMDEDGVIFHELQAHHFLPPSLRVREQFYGVHLQRNKVLSLINRMKPDLVHSNAINMVLGMSRAICRTCPLIVTAHAASDRELTAVGRVSLSPVRFLETVAGFSVSAYLLACERAVLPDATYTLAVSPQVREDLIRRYRLDPDRVIVVPNAVDTDAFAPDEDRRATSAYVLYVGRLVPRKGIEALVGAMAIMAPKLDDVFLHVVGIGPLRSYLEAFARRLGIQDRVKFMGHMRRHELIREYQNCRLLVVPSYYEPFSLVALEAMSCGRPVAIPPNTGLSLLLAEENCLIPIDPSNEEKMAEILYHVLRDRKDLNALGARARSICMERFSTHLVPERILKIYNMAVSSPSQAPHHRNANTCQKTGSLEDDV